MTEMLLFLRNEEECSLIRQQAKDAVAFCSDDTLHIREAHQAAKAAACLSANEALDMAVMEIAEQADILLSEQARGRYREAQLMLVVDQAISPMMYLTPQVRAASLLLRPFTREQAKEVIRDFIRDYYRQQERQDEKNCYLLRTKDGERLIPYHRILYFEIREKRLYIRLRHKEYSQYETLEHIAEGLPGFFLRCHRSFIFNLQYLEKIALSQNMIYLEQGISIPLSRTYKADVKDFLDGVRNG